MRSECGTDDIATRTSERALTKAPAPTGEAMLPVDTTPEGSIVLKPAGIYPIEIYSEQRVDEFLAEDRMTSEELRKVKRRGRGTC